MIKGTIFVTGASTGIGRATVDRLAADSYAVIAGVRRDADAPPAAAGHVLIDLSEPESVVAAAKHLLEQTDGSLIPWKSPNGLNLPNCPELHEPTSVISRTCAPLMPTAVILPTSPC